MAGWPLVAAGSAWIQVQNYSPPYSESKNRPVVGSAGRSRASHLKRGHMDKGIWSVPLGTPFFLLLAFGSLFLMV